MNRICFLFILQWLMVLSVIGQHENEVEEKLRALNYFEGSWNVNVEARLSAQGPWDTSIASSIMKFTTGSKIVEEDFKGTRAGKPFLVKMLLAVNNLTGSYQRIFADSEHGALVDYEGTKNDQRFVFDKLWTYPNKSIVQLRVVYTIISTDEFIVENMRMPQGTTTWDVTGRMRYKRIN